MTTCSVKYDCKKIGKRIKNERKKLGFTQSEFAEKLGYGVNSRQSIAKWESGEKMPDLNLLLNMCDMFGCELGYLLCEFDCKTRTATDIKKETGLSEKSIEKLHNFNLSAPMFMNILNYIIEHDSFEDLLRAMYIYTSEIESIGKPLLSENAQQELAHYFGCRPGTVTDYLEVTEHDYIKETLDKIMLQLKGKSKRIYFSDNCHEE